jgi:arylsulfatase A-like enzyme
MNNKKRKNILMIMCDQFNAQWMSCAGSDYIHTPNIDKIADNGIMFTQAACNSPVCAPSRISLAGGQYPHRLGSLDNFSMYPLGQKETYYEVLRKSGYRVGVVGKTDLHKADHYNGINGDNPFMYQMGFTDPVEVEGKMHAMKTLDFRWNPKLPEPGTREPLGPYQKFLMDKGTMEKFAEDYFDRKFNEPMWFSDKSVLSHEEYIDAFIGMKSCDFLDNVSKEYPWHLFVSFDGPHDPWDAPEKYLKLYENSEFPPSIKDNMEGKPEWIKKRQQKHSKGMSSDDLNSLKQNYAGMIKHIDDWVGNILDSLNNRGMEDNTTIIFCADHGEMLGNHGLFQKRVMYEDSLRVPLIISDPDIKRRGKTDALAELVDLYPTILDIANVEYESRNLDGKSLIPILTDGEKKHKLFQVAQIVHSRMIYDGRYKFIHNINDSNELYDLQNDPMELNNIIKENPKLVHSLKWSLNKVLAGVDD